MAPFFRFVLVVVTILPLASCAVLQTAAEEILAGPRERSATISIEQRITPKSFFGASEPMAQAFAAGLTLRESGLSYDGEITNIRYQSTIPGFETEYSTGEPPAEEEERVSERVLSALEGQSFSWQTLADGTPDLTDWPSPQELESSIDFSSLNSPAALQNRILQIAARENAKKFVSLLVPPMKIDGPMERRAEVTLLSNHSIRTIYDNVRDNQADFRMEFSPTSDRSGLPLASMTIQLLLNGSISGTMRWDDDGWIQEMRLEQNLNGQAVAKPDGFPIGAPAPFTIEGPIVFRLQ